MKNNFGFFKQARFTGIIALIFFVVSITMSYLNMFKSEENIYISDGIIKSEFKYLTDNESKDFAIAHRNDYVYSDREGLGLGKFEFFDPKGVILKLTITPIYEEETYFVVNTKNLTKQYIDVYSEDSKLNAVTPKIIEYTPESDYDFYLLPLNEDTTTIYMYFNKEFNENGFTKPTFTVGTESALILLSGESSVVNFVVAGIVVILGLFIYIIFFITNIENYNVVKIFAVTFFIIAIQCIMFSPFVLLTFNKYIYFFTLVKIITYYLLCIASYLVVLSYISNKLIKKIYFYNIIASVILVIGSTYLFATYSPFAGKVVNIYNVYYIIICMFTLVLNFYNFEADKDSSSIIRTFAFSAMVTLNTFFLHYETDNSSSAYDSPYYVVLFIFIACVLIYIYTIFYYRNKKIRDNKLFLYDEKETIDRLYKSNKNTITTTNILQISENILSDIEGIYPHNKFAMIIHRGQDRNISIPAHTDYKGDIERHAHKVFKKYYKNIPKSSYVANFTGDTAVLLFKSSTGEILIIYFKNEVVLSSLDRLAGEILAAPVLLSFNNCRIYDEMANTEKELLFAIGKLIYKKGENPGNIWRVGEYATLLAKNTGLTDELANDLRIAAYIHDIGLIGMNDDYVNIDKISSAEEAIFYQHTRIGFDMLSKFSSETMQLAGVCSLFHHEKYNGKGYIGRVAEEIPIEARIISICSDFESFYAKLAIERPDATRAELLEESYAYLSMHKQAKYDPLLVQLFIKDRAGIDKIIKLSKDK